MIKWNKQGAQFQKSRKGTTKAHVYYFVTTIGTGNGEWAVGYYGYGKQVVMKSAGTFPTAKQARQFCQLHDATRLLIEEVI
jgi:hypothetical protein